MQPLVYFSYGMTKSGSTLAFELARSAFELGGCPQPRLSTQAVENKKKLNFCGHIDAARADAIRRETQAIGTPIAIKTHTRPDPEVVKMLQNNEAFAHATFRDPREIALSMVDHGNRNRMKGGKAFTEYQNVEDTLENIMHQSNSLLAWLSLPNVKPLYYNHVAFDTRDAAQTLINELGLNVDIDLVVKTATQDRFTQKNKAVPNRYRTDMDEATSARFRSVFASMFERLIEKYERLPRDGAPVLDHKIPLCDWSQLTPQAAGTHP